MLITSEVHYALLLMVYMTKAGDRLVKRKEVCEEEGIPPHFLAKIAQNLAKAGLITITQGSRGGYLLDCDPRVTTAYNVISAIKGGVKVTPFIVNRKMVTGEIEALYDRVDDAAIHALDSATLVDLAY
jgi:Rrf2 family protein